MRHGLHARIVISSFYAAAPDVNSGPHPCPKATSTTKLSPQLPGTLKKCVCLCVCSDQEQRISDLEWELHMVWGHLIRMPGTKSGPVEEQ